MAAGPVTVIDVAIEKIGNEINLETDQFTVVLCDSSQALSASFTGGSGQALYSDLTGEIVGAGYTEGGAALAAKDWSRSGAVVSFSADPTQWEGLNGEVKYAVVCRLNDAVSPPAPDHILAVVDVETTEPDGRVSTGGDFIINWSTALFTITRAS